MEGCLCLKKKGAQPTHAPTQALTCPPRNAFSAPFSGRASKHRPWNEIVSFELDSSRSYAKFLIVSDVCVVGFLLFQKLNRNPTHNWLFSLFFHRFDFRENYATLPSESRWEAIQKVLSFGNASFFISARVSLLNHS